MLTREACKTHRCSDARRTAGRWNRKQPDSESLAGRWVGSAIDRSDRTLQSGAAEKPDAPRHPAFEATQEGRSVTHGGWRAAQRVRLVAVSTSVSREFG